MPHSPTDEAPVFLAVTARHDRRSERVMIILNNGAVVRFPPSLLPGLEQANPNDLRKIEVEGGVYGLHVASLGADISLPSLLRDNLGSAIMKLPAACTDTSKTNRGLSGRPRKTRAF